MTKFRKRPVVVEAAQYFDHLPPPEGVEPIWFWIDTSGFSLVIGERDLAAQPPDPTYRAGWGIKTLEGWHLVRHRDWIITGIHGEKYPCKPDVFAATYEEDGDREADQ